MTTSLRPVAAEDTPFLFALYSSTRAEELEAWGWDAAQREAFLQLQFRAQQQHYRAYGSQLDQQLICQDDMPIGEVILIREDQALYLSFIALMPEFRNAGIGTKRINAVLDEARRSSRPVRLHVRPTNRAIRLYTRLGFVALENDGVQILMEWRLDQ